MFRLNFGEMEDLNHNDKPLSNGATEDELSRNCNQYSEEIGSTHTEEKE